MELSVNDDKIKVMMTEILEEMLKENKDIFREILLEALEDEGLANSIVDGRKNEFVHEDKIFSLLESES